ncbi:membrane-bound PQQ-dependent dehydrogenase, glucose/quinate/shikimate family [Paraburkholderia acidisoli]|uniref:Membrane-bound PQQ-dependent dehydrogenase, glucose/quinate/shikimate family n=2 Tax=Paraburkholderia acidisoli TaxID=2571748 RepID=A0A7Z2JK20_9BURK|nr:membrane-bound PQQ-dependent dehydrogenase, glucose/quinate/shikimate family [Paraburkholderia acidisoli]
MSTSESALARWGRLLLALVLAVFGLCMVIGGVWLIALGGNWYYAIAGVLSIGSAIGLFRRSRAAATWFAVLFVITLAWTIWESGTDYWGWVPRFALMMLFAIAFSFLLPSLRPDLSRKLTGGISAVLVLGFVVAIGLAFVPYHVTTASDVPVSQGDPFAADTGSSVAAGIPGTDWPSYGGDQAAQRFSSATQITPANVKDLRVAWTARAGETPSGAKWGNQNTPLKIGNTLYVCAFLNKVVALDAATGSQKWVFDPHVNPDAIPYTPSCRSLAYYADPAANAQTPAPASSGDSNPAAAAACSRRIVLGTLDGRVIEIDANTGKRCADFGNHGEVSILEDMGKTYKGYVAISSGPVVVRDTIVVGHEVVDGQRAFGPPGVVKAYNVKTGALKWAWDAATPYDPKPRHGDNAYKRGSPDVWTSFTGDDKLGLVYLPVANASGDYYSSTRTPEELKFSPSLTALDVETGMPRWSFQNAHNDVWDYDPGSPPTLYDYKAPDGKIVPAILFPTKNAQMYVLNRATGKPLFGVQERPAPQGGIEPAARAKTQPYSLFNSYAKPDLKPENTWGLTPLDQLYCRIQFQQADYRGSYTPPRLDKPIIDYPGYNGGSDWGGVSFDPTRGLVVINYNDMPNYTRLVSRKQADKLGWHALDVVSDPNAKASQAEGQGDPQAGLPIAVDVNAGWQLPFTGMLCKEPPYGGIRAVDVRTGRTVWDRPLGTARENGPFGLPTGLPINIGTPNNGGSVVTQSGLVFIAAATDDLIRAIDINTGKTVWSAPLPAGGQANPMVYEEGGREFVVIEATGHHFMHTPKGNYVVAYALPQS